ncbi:Uncharacterised protein [Klebsiella variicola]|nr:Uncharacterised protein [Klebsiella variicola]
MKHVTVMWSNVTLMLIICVYVMLNGGKNNISNT